MKHFSFFSGCGGMDLGIEGGFDSFNKFIDVNIGMSLKKISLERTGIETVFVNDICSSALKLHKTYFKKRNTFADYEMQSIVDIVESKILNQESNGIPVITPQNKQHSIIKYGKTALFLGQ